MGYATMQGMMPGAAQMDPRKKLMERLGYAAPEPAQQRLGVSGYGMGTAAPAPAPAPIPPAPAPVAPAGRMAMPAPAMQPAGAYSDAIFEGKNPDQIAGPSAGSSMLSQLTPEELQEYQMYDRLLYSMPDFKGRHEQNEALKSMWVYRKIQDRKNKGEADYRGTAKIGDFYDGANDRLMAQLSARGIGGSGIEAGATSRLRGMEGQAVGDYVSTQDERERDRMFQRQQQEQQMLMQILMGGLQQNIQEQNDPGLLGDILGIGGSLLGSALPGIGGLLGGGDGGDGPYRGPYGAIRY